MRAAIRRHEVRADKTKYIRLQYEYGGETLINFNDVKCVQKKKSDVMKLDGDWCWEFLIYEKNGDKHKVTCEYKKYKNISVEQFVKDRLVYI
jgi:hypothetical protein